MGKVLSVETLDIHEGMAKFLRNELPREVSEGNARFVNETIWLKLMAEFFQTGVDATTLLNRGGSTGHAPDVYPRGKGAMRVWIYPTLRSFRIIDAATCGHSLQVKSGGVVA